MNYTKTLSVARLWFKLSAYFSLFGMGSLILFDVLFILAKHYSYNLKQFGPLYEASDSWGWHLGVYLGAISSYLLYRVFRSLAQLLTLFAVNLLSVGVDLVNSKAFDLVAEAYPTKAPSPGLRECLELVFANFSGASSLGLALLLYLLARFIQEGITLKKEVEALREESSLTV